MKLPSWALVVGVCLILFGGCSISSNIGKINSPDAFEFQEGLMDSMKDVVEKSMDEAMDEAEKDSVFSETISKLKDEPGMEIIEEMAGGIENLFTISEFTKIWTVRFGYIGVAIAIIYLLSGVILFLRKSFSIKFVLFALGISIIFSIVESIVLSSGAQNFLLSISAGFGNIFSIIIDVILLVVILANDKRSYFNTVEEEF